VTRSDVFPRTCSTFLSHAYEGDGTSRFTDLLKDFIERRFICSVWYDKSEMHDTSEFFDEMKIGLQEASTVIICLTPLYMTRPNCLRELRWALDLRDYESNVSKEQKRRIHILALHPMMTHAGRQVVISNRCVFLPKFQHSASPTCEEHVVVHSLSDQALELLGRLNERGFYHKFIDAMPWRSDFEDWNQSVPIFDFVQSGDVPRSVADFFKSSATTTVAALMEDFCNSNSESFKKPPIPSVEWPRLEFAELKKNSDLESSPRTLTNSDEVAAHSLSDFFKKFLSKDESSFDKSLFAHKDMYMLTLFGFTDDQLVFLLDNPIGFKDAGVGNRSMIIDKDMRKSALLSLSREFSDKLIDKKAISSDAVPIQEQPVAQSAAKNSKSRGTRNNSFDLGDRKSYFPSLEAEFVKRGPGSISNQSMASAAAGSAEGSIAIQLVQFFPSLLAQLASLNEHHKDMKESLKDRAEVCCFDVLGRVCSDSSCYRKNQNIIMESK
jgi:hypothetical protein